MAFLLQHFNFDTLDTMADSGFDLMQKEAGNDQIQIQPIDNVQEPQAAPQFAEPADPAIPDATVLSNLRISSNLHF